MLQASEKVLEQNFIALSLLINVRERCSTGMFFQFWNKGVQKLGDKFLANWHVLIYDQHTVTSLEKDPFLE